MAPTDGESSTLSGVDSDADGTEDEMKRNPMRLWPAAALLVAIAAAMPGLARAQPSVEGAARIVEASPSGRPIRLLVGVPPGGSVDLMARIFAGGLQARLGRPVVVENRAGAGGVVAAEAVARAAPDGDTLGATTANVLVASRHVLERMGFDPLTDLVPISRLAEYPYILLASPGFPARDLAGAGVALRSGALDCGSPGAGSMPHLVLALLLRELRADCTIAHYRGASLALPDLATGRIGLLPDIAVAGLAAARNGTVRALAVTSAARSPLAPEVPTVAETVPGFVVESWLALTGPRELGAGTLAQLEVAAIAVARDPAIVDRLRREGATAVGSSAAALAGRVREEDAAWGALVRAAGIRSE